MENLLSGLFGALIATVLSAVYSYVAEQIRLRTEVTLEVVGYCDDIFNRLQTIHAHKDHVYTNTDSCLEPDIYRANNRELSVLLKSTKTHAKLEIVYGIGESVAALNALSHHFREAASILRSSTENDWPVKGKWVLDLFEGKIDPLRNDLERKLIDGTRATAIPLGVQLWEKVT